MQFSSAAIFTLVLVVLAVTVAGQYDEPVPPRPVISGAVPVRRIGGGTRGRGGPPPPPGPPSRGRGSPSPQLPLRALPAPIPPRPVVELEEDSLSTLPPPTYSPTTFQPPPFRPQEINIPNRQQFAGIQLEEAGLEEERPQQETRAPEEPPVFQRGRPSPPAEQEQSFQQRVTRPQQQQEEQQNLIRGRPQQVQDEQQQVRGRPHPAVEQPPAFTRGRPQEQPSFVRARPQPAQDVLPNFIRTRPQPPQEENVVRGRPEEQPRLRPVAAVEPQTRPQPSYNRAQLSARPSRPSQQPAAEQEDVRVPADKTRRKKPTAQTIKKYRDDNADGSITWGFENDDGTFKEETIGIDCVTRGKYGYFDPEGVRREFTYTSGIPCDKRNQDDSQAGATNEGYIDYSNNKYVFPNGQEINLDNMVKNRARRPVYRN